MKPTSSIVAALSFFALMASVAIADNANPREACRDDARDYCQGVQPGGGRIMECLKDHYKEISDDCYHALQRREPHANGDEANPPPEASQNPR